MGWRFSLAAILLGGTLGYTGHYLVERGVGDVMSAGAQVTEAPPAALESPGMRYYLANEAFFSGDTEVALNQLEALGGEGVEVAALCKGVSLDLQIRGRLWSFCNPDLLRAPPEVEAWVARRLQEGKSLADSGDPVGALAALDPAFQADPYRPDLHEWASTWAAQAGQPSLASEHQERATALNHVRVQAFESLSAPRL